MSRPNVRPWMRLVGMLALLAGPAAVYYMLSHAALPAAVVSGVIVVVVIKHLGLLAVVFGPLYVLFRRRPRR